MPRRCCCVRVSLSTFGCCWCCCTVPLSKEKLPLLDDERTLTISSTKAATIRNVDVPNSYVLSKKKDISKQQIRIVTIADSHMHHNSYNMPKGDVLIIAGDFTKWKTTETDITKVMDWINSLTNYQLKIIICGNHEISLNNKTYNELKDLFETKCNAIYLQESSVEYAGLKFYGFPYHPKRGCLFQANSFGANLNKMKQICKNIPNDTDILITHSPPYGIRDKNKAGKCWILSIVNQCSTKSSTYYAYIWTCS
eukprot:UN02863